MPLAEHDGRFVLFSLTTQVSIHEPRAEHDKDAALAKDAGDVSIPVPPAEHHGQIVLFDHAAGAIWFQFTCPSRSTTVCPAFLRDTTLVAASGSCAARSTLIDTHVSRSVSHFVQVVPREGHVN